MAAALSRTLLFTAFLKARSWTSDRPRWSGVLGLSGLVVWPPTPPENKS